MAVAVCYYDAHGGGEFIGLLDELWKEGAIIPLTGGHRHGYGELRVRAGDDVKLVAIDPLTGAGFEAPGGIGVRRVSDLFFFLGLL